MSSASQSSRRTKPALRKTKSAASGPATGSRVDRDVARATSERLSLAMAAAQLGEWSWDAASDVLRGSPRAAEIVGVPPDTAITRAALRQLVPAEESRRARREIGEALEQRREFDVEFPIQREGGVVWVAVRGRGLYAPTGGVTGMAGVAADITARKHTEVALRESARALRESEQKFRTLASLAPVGIFMTDAAGHCVFVNESWTTMAGIGRQEAAGIGWSRALHPDDRARVFVEWQAAARARRTFALEYRFMRPDGTVTWVQGNAVAAHDTAGEISGYIGTISDITERKAAEFLLRESEKRFRTVANRAPVGIFMTDAQGETIFVNETWCAIAGIPAAQAQGPGWMNAVHPDDRVRLREGWEEAVRGGAASSAEYRFLRPDGSVVWVQGSAVQLRDPMGRTTGYVGTVGDITDRKRAEEKLRAQEAQLRLISTNAPIILAHCSRDLKFLFVNRAYAERFKQKPEDITGRAIEDVLGAEAFATIQPYITRVLAGESFDYESELNYKELGRRFMRISYVPDIGADGVVRGWLSAVTDLTERRRMEEALRASEAELERKVAERTASLREAIGQMEEFSYSVSHDLRSPLRAMNAYAQALIDDYGPQLDETARGYLERIQRSSVRMEKLTHDVLNYSRVARGEVTLAPVDLEPLLSGLIEQYAQLQPAAADVTIRRPLHRVRAHEPSLGQSLGNLLTNAAKFVRPGERPQIRVGTEARGTRVRIWIEDDGIGIPPQYQAALFQVFERLPTPVNYEGTGIGLAIVRRAAEKMGGTCGVESDGDRGSRFWIELSNA